MIRAAAKITRANQDVGVSAPKTDTASMASVRLPPKLGSNFSAANSAVASAWAISWTGSVMW